MRNIQCIPTPLLFVRRRSDSVPFSEPPFPRMAGSELWNAGSETVTAGEDFGENTADSETITADEMDMTADAE